LPAQDSSHHLDGWQAATCTCIALFLRQKNILKKQFSSEFQPKYFRVDSKLFCRHSLPVKIPVAAILLSLVLSF